VVALKKRKHGTNCPVGRGNIGGLKYTMGERITDGGLDALLWRAKRRKGVPDNDTAGEGNLSGWKSAKLSGPQLDKTSFQRSKNFGFFGVGEKPGPKVSENGKKKLAWEKK